MSDEIDYCRLKISRASGPMSRHFTLHKQIVKARHDTLLKWLVYVAGLIQLMQYYYQSGSLYRLRALGERRTMDITVGMSTAHASHSLLACTTRSKKGCPYSITERRVLELIPVLGSQPAGDVSHKPGGRLPLLSTRTAVTPATLKRAAASLTAW